jgi:hypothetical protein
MSVFDKYRIAISKEIRQILGEGYKEPEKSHKIKAVYDKYNKMAEDEENRRRSEKVSGGSSRLYP